MKTIYLLLAPVFVFVSCLSDSPFQDAVAVWQFAQPVDTVQLVPALHGDVRFIPLDASEVAASKARNGNGAVAAFSGGWLDAGQGVAGELNLAGREVTLLARIKADSVIGSHPILTKTGTDRNIAYSLSLERRDDGAYLEALLGSDEIGGAHYLKYKLPGEELLDWHDVLFRFNGQTSQLYVDGYLRDDEVTVGTVRDWNRRPVQIGARYKSSAGYGEGFGKDSIEACFYGRMDHVAIWNRYLADAEVEKLSGVDELREGKPEYYKETYRPQFHFTARKNWLNDPNGLVYYDGVYHLFFQYMPPYRPGAYKDWGHAVSTDLVHWKQIPKHITPHKVWAGCWSGSAVVDEHNCAGLQTGKEKTIVAFLTNGGHPAEGLGPLCTQCMAYSTDGGTTFTYYDQNPVIRNLHNANRDPKVVWDEDSRQWIMSLYMDEGYDFALFASTDLKQWRHLSTFTLDGVAECPGFEPLPVDGDTERKKWIFFGANGNYRIGSFDGKAFRPETKVLRGDYGKNFYAAQTWSNVPDGRCLHIAWMPTRRYPGMPFEQQMNFPTELTLRTTPEGIKAFRNPIREIRTLYDKEYRWSRRIFQPGDNLFNELRSDLYDISLEVAASSSGSFEIGIRGATITYDAVRQKLSCGGPCLDHAIIPENWRASKENEVDFSNNLGEAPLFPRDNKIKLRILVDRTSIEIFGNDGEVVLTSCFMPQEENKMYSFTSKDKVELIKAEVHSLKSAWEVSGQ